MESVHEKVLVMNDPAAMAFGSEMPMPSLDAAALTQPTSRSASIPGGGPPENSYATALVVSFAPQLPRQMEE